MKILMKLRGETIKIREILKCSGFQYYPEHDKSMWIRWFDSMNHALDFLSMNYEFIQKITFIADVKVFEEESVAIKEKIIKDKVIVEEKVITVDKKIVQELFGE